MFRNLNAELARADKGHKDLAIALDVSVKTISNKMQGYSEFTLSEIMAVAELFPNSSVEYLFETS